MALSEKSKEDKQSLKNGITALIVLVACFTIGPVGFAEFTGVDTETLCVTDQRSESNTERCLEDEGYKGQVKTGLQEVLGFWMPLIVFIIGVSVSAWMGIKY